MSDRIVVLVKRLPMRIRADKGDQIMRAADSIHEAIAEGCGLNTDPQLAKHLRIALGSANEVEDELGTLFRRGGLKDQDTELLELSRRVCAMLAMFIRGVDPASPSISKRPTRSDSRSDSRSRSRGQAADSE